MNLPLSRRLVWCAVAALLAVAPAGRSAGAEGRERAFVPPGQYAAAGKELTVTFIDVGQGDAAYLRTPGGRNVLIDGGARSVRLPDGKEIRGREAIEFLKGRGVRSLDALIISHAHPDHTSGLATVLRDYDVGKVYDTGFGSDDPGYAEILKLISEKNIPYEKVFAGDMLAWDGGLTVEVLAPPRTPFESVNDNSLIIRLAYGNVRFLFTGDAEEEEQIWAVRNGREKLAAGILKVPHHGSSTSLNRRFLAAVQPEIAVLSCALDNPFGHPHAEMLYRYRVLGIPLYRTDYDGNVTVRTDGKTFTVVTASPAETR